MDRKIIYPGQIPMAEDQLQAARFTQIGVGRLAGALYDESGTGASGFACTPGSGLSVTISPGQITQPGTIDASVFGVLPASASALPRQYVLADPVNVAIPGAGATYVVYGTPSTTDTANAVLPYYNSANPAQTFAGASNSGQTQPTVRTDAVTIGIATSVPSGSIPLWSIIVPSGATAITSTMISAASGAPLYPSLRRLAMRIVAPFNAALASAFGGYPSKSIVADPTTTGVFWVSTADNNLTTPGASGASWQNLFANILPSQQWAQRSFIPSSGWSISNTATFTATGSGCLMLCIASANIGGGGVQPVGCTLSINIDGTQVAADNTIESMSLSRTTILAPGAHTITANYSTGSSSSSAWSSVGLSSSMLFMPLP